MLVSGMTIKLAIPISFLKLVIFIMFTLIEVVVEITFCVGR